MPGAITNTQIAAITAWFAASSQDYLSPLGQLIRRGPYATLVNLGLDTAPPAAATSLIASGVLPIYSPDAVGPGDLTVPNEQQSVFERARHVIWAAAQGKTDRGLRIPPVAVVSLPTAATTIRAACTAAGISVTADRAVLAVPVYAFPAGAPVWGTEPAPTPNQQVRLGRMLPVL